MNRLAALSAYVGDTATATVRLHAAVTITTENWPMARALALHAAALQVADAHAEAGELARVFGARVHATAHPERGRRPTPDEMLGVVEVYQQRGQQPAPYTIEDIASLVHLEPRPWVLAANEPTRLVADLAFAEGQPSRLELDASSTHPALGSGLQLRLWLPLEPDAAIAQRLNANEAAQPDAHHLGAWCLDPDRGLGYASFIPSAACLPDLPKTLVYHAAGRNSGRGTCCFLSRAGGFSRFSGFCGSAVLRFSGHARARGFAPSAPPWLCCSGLRAYRGFGGPWPSVHLRLPGYRRIGGAGCPWPSAHLRPWLPLSGIGGAAARGLGASAALLPVAYRRIGGVGYPPRIYASVAQSSDRVTAFFQPAYRRSRWSAGICGRNSRSRAQLRRTSSRLLQ